MNKPDIDMPGMDCYRSSEAMGTRFEVFLQGEDQEHLDAVAVAVLEEIARLDATLSRFDPRSELARVNRHAWQQPVRVERELFELLVRCEQARVLTEGYFDVTRGTGLLLDAERCLLRFTRAETKLDLGGIGKGYALDCGREILTRYGVTSGLLQGGTSSVLAIGSDAWPIALRHPLRPEQIVTKLELRDCGLACSAVRHVGQTCSDVINPLTQAPLTGDAACVVLAANATEAEIFSTALLAMGRARAKQYLVAHSKLALTVGWIDAQTEFCWLSQQNIL